MFYYKEYTNPVSGNPDKNLIKVLADGNHVSFAFGTGPLFDEYEAWVADGNVATEWQAN